MSEETNFSIRLSKAAKEFNVGKDTIVEYLAKKGFQVDPSPNTKLTADMYALLVKEYQGEKEVKNEAMKLGNLSYKGGSVSVDSALQSQKPVDEEDHEEVIIRTTTISSPTKKTAKPVAAEPEKVEAKEETPTQEVEAEPEKKEPEKVEPEKKEENTSGISLNILGKIDLEPKPHQNKKKEKKPEKQPAQPQEKKQEKPQQQKPVEKKQEEPVKVTPAKVE